MENSGGMNNNIKQFLKKFYQDKRINIFDAVDELESTLTTLYPDNESEIKVLVSILGHDIIKPFGSQNVILNKRKLAELKKTLHKDINFPENQIEAAIITWAEVFGATIKVKIKQAKSSKASEPKKKKEVNRKKNKFLFRKIIFAVSLIIMIVTGFTFRELLFENFSDLWNTVFVKENIIQNDEQKTTADRNEVALTENTDSNDVLAKSTEPIEDNKTSDKDEYSTINQPSRVPDKTTYTEWTKEGIIQDLIEITSAYELANKLNEYGEGRHHIIVVGSREQAGSAENDYVFIYDNKKVYGVFQNSNNSVVQIKANMSYDSLKTNQPDTREVWIHFVKSQGRY